MAEGCKYRYFVSFAHEGGFGNVEMCADGLVYSIKDVQAMARLLMSENADLKSVTILTFNLLNKE